MSRLLSEHLCVVPQSHILVHSLMGLRSRIISLTKSVSPLNPLMTTETERTLSDIAQPTLPNRPLLSLPTLPSHPPNFPAPTTEPYNHARDRHGPNTRWWLCEEVKLAWGNGYGHGHGRGRDGVFGAGEGWVEGCRCESGLGWERWDGEW